MNKELKTNNKTYSVNKIIQISAEIVYLKLL